MLSKVGAGYGDGAGLQVPGTKALVAGNVAR
jgi:hypothetical protein